VFSCLTSLSKISVPDDELDLIRKKLELARFPTGIENAEWAEDNKVTLPFIRETVDFWLNRYDWREEERKINEMPQFKTRIEQGEFGEFNVHFVHARSNAEGAIPLIFIHGWPGSFIEVQKVLQPLRAAGFHVVAPSLLGYGFSSYTNKAGLNYLHQGQVFHKLMLRLGYKNYAVQGGDWGAIVAKGIALQFPDNARVLHTNMVGTEGVLPHLLLISSRLLLSDPRMPSR
jgi:pimeloyl-ACP methyl ester carboxylesterase